MPQVDGAYVKVKLTARGPSLIALTMTAPPGAFFISPQGENHVSDDDDEEEEEEEDVSDNSETVFVVKVYQEKDNDIGYDWDARRSLVLNMIIFDENCNCSILQNLIILDFSKFQ